MVNRSKIIVLRSDPKVEDSDRCQKIFLTKLLSILVGVGGEVCLWTFSWLIGWKSEGFEYRRFWLPQKNISDRTLANFNWSRARYQSRQSYSPLLPTPPPPPPLVNLPLLLLHTNLILLLPTQQPNNTWHSWLSCPGQTWPDYTQKRTCLPMEARACAQPRPDHKIIIPGFFVFLVIS